MKSNLFLKETVYVIHYYYITNVSLLLLQGAVFILYIDYVNKYTEHVTSGYSSVSIRQGWCCQTYSSFSLTPILVTQKMSM